MVHHLLRSKLTKLGAMTSRPWAFLVLIGYVVVWLIFDPGSFGWHSLATMATWAMTLFIQRAEHRDTQAVHAKLDELLIAAGGARNELARLDEEEPEEIEEERERIKG